MSVNAAWEIIRASENVGDYLPISHAEALGLPVDRIISAEPLHAIKNRLQAGAGNASVERLFDTRLKPQSAAFDITVHVASGETVLEFEPAATDANSTHLLLRMVNRLQTRGTLLALYKETVRQMRTLTEFDRVSLYRFDEDGVGQVLAESLKPAMESHLGRCCPVALIPAQHPEMARRSPLRLIFDSEARRVPVTPVSGPDAGPADLSMSILRCAEPEDITYLQSLGARCSLSVALPQGDTLWGAIVCHALEPKPVGPEARATAELLGQIFSYRAEALQREDDDAYETRAHELRSRIGASFQNPQFSLHSLAELLVKLPDYIEADGAGLRRGGEVALSGAAPGEADFLDMLDFLDRTVSTRIFATHRLRDIYPVDAVTSPAATGILCVPISRSQQDYLVFFRGEQSDERRPLVPDGTITMPQRQQSARWARRELRAADALRLMLIEKFMELPPLASRALVPAPAEGQAGAILASLRRAIPEKAAADAQVEAMLRQLDARLEQLERAPAGTVNGPGTLAAMRLFLHRSAVIMRVTFGNARAKALLQRARRQRRARLANAEPPLLPDPLKSPDIANIHRKRGP